MRTFSLITALSLSILGWISFLGVESHGMEANSGEDVTLLCANMSKYDSFTFWFRLDTTNRGSVKRKPPPSYTETTFTVVHTVQTCSPTIRIMINITLTTALPLSRCTLLTSSLSPEKVVSTQK
ncbi:hypothetical protein Q8A73_013307 [Channa argus]|nr:hypothetical protein Q8A73_013307 [Channa argus]